MKRKNYIPHYRECRGTQFPFKRPDVFLRMTSRYGNLDLQGISCSASKIG